MPMRPIKEPQALCEAYEYERPVPFSRGMRVDLAGATFLFISGTASVDEHGASLYPGDLERQARRMFDNITRLLASEGATWRNVVRTTIYLKDMADYDRLAQVRMAFFKEQGVDVYPASTCVQATLCRPELLVETEAIAVIERTAG